MPAKSASVEPAPARASNGAASVSPADKSKPVYKINKERRPDLLYDREQKSLDDRVKDGTLKNAVKERRESVSSEKNLLVKMNGGVRLRSYERSDTQKDSATTEMLRAACVKSILFNGMTRHQQELIINMFSAIRTRRHDVVIEQGEALTDGEGDNFYIVGEGSFDIFRDATMTVLPEGVVEKHQLKQDEVLRGRSSTAEFVQHRHAGDTFGELALMYSCPRQATVKCASDTAVLWALPREVSSCVEELTASVSASACPPLHYRSLCALPRLRNRAFGWIVCMLCVPCRLLPRFCRPADAAATHRARTDELASGLAVHRCTARWLPKRRSTRWIKSPRP